ncbi:hypothetical protein ISF_04235 [Cordyceps fumosorosea ARSEF 2679]|uniref:Uncharacterized protein n=1 Tax=Cordyceps fumosorosea (strain ARSEF 2679) TaxID=1081104 RepID=A0A167XD07_CORFA|nr:hypothetical protein ISF_04235 [Cordyceps fumosorosea ARSEF 2679]OAA64825.1 hypothetical protein ISF_04235 [Cordyceps fumosorosea ARSEF 2679]
MCELTKILHLCGHETGETRLELCGLKPGISCQKPRERHQTVYSYCTGASHGRKLSQCRRLAFCSLGWVCHECGLLSPPVPKPDSVPLAVWRAKLLFSIACEICGAKESPLSRLPGP